MSNPSVEAPPILAVYLLIAQYPILAKEIRRQMREELFRRGVITSQLLEVEVREKALLSQKREGLTNPLVQETSHQWEQRLELLRDHLTDFYFAYNLPLDLLHRILGDALLARTSQPQTTLSFNPELAPIDLLLNQAELFESLPAAERAKVSHHLQEIIVVLTKTMISDQLGFVSVAKHWFTAEDFRFIQTHRIGTGKVGGKSAGMLLAHKILKGAAPAIADRVHIPRSYFVGADVFYDFIACNGLDYLDQKYKPLEEITTDYERIQQEHIRSRFPEGVADRLREILAELGHAPLIVRSSSLLEDNFGASFAGKYESFFCPNQGTPRENLRDLTNAIRRVYASIYCPDAILYRRKMGLIDYDERMAILLQEVQGQPHRQYYFPPLAGVAYSFSPLVWSSRLRRDEGFVRLVLGMGTRAVDRMDNDYPRLINLSHPQLRPEKTPEALRHYTQRLVDVVDLERNAFVTIPTTEVLNADFAPLRWLASVDDGDTLQPLFTSGAHLDSAKLVLTFDNLLAKSDFASLLKTVLMTLAKQYGNPVDVEFAVVLEDGPKLGLAFSLLQCRPQSHATAAGQANLARPADLREEDRIFQACRLAPQGAVSQVEYLIFVDPEAYTQLPDAVDRKEAARLIGRLNKALEGRDFILIGPGRWGSANDLLGVPVSYADIFNARALVEVAVKQHGLTPEPSYGTHFFQDLVEAHIFPVAVYPDEPGDSLNWKFISGAVNRLAELLPAERSEAAQCVKVIRIPSECQGRHLEIDMDGERSLAYIAAGGNGG
jgi:hypothetical protein